MQKYGWTILFIAGLLGVLLTAKGFSASAQTRASSAEITLAYAAPEAGAIDVYVDHELAIRNFSSGDPAVSIQVSQGDHLVDVFPAGGDIVMMKTTEMAFEAGHSYRIVLDGSEAGGSVALGIADEALK